MPDPISTEAITSVSQLGPTGLAALVFWQVVRAVDQLRDWVRDSREALASEAAHRKAEAEFWARKEARQERHEELLRALAERAPSPRLPRPR
jgi:hypothetical protein